MKKAILYLFVSIVFIAACKTVGPVIHKKSSDPSVTGTAFYTTSAAWGWKQRDSLAEALILAGQMPDFLKRFTAVKVHAVSASSKKLQVVYYVSPDYLSVGTNEDWARIPLTPMAAQRIADSFHCFLPTPQITNDIYAQAKVKLAPVPMYAFRDSTVTMWQHHLIIEGQRKGRKGLIAGIKKDVVLSGKLLQDPRPNRVAIYGWHQLNGKPIQPVYTGHVNWYVDYSHGIRLVYRTIWVNGRPMDYTAVMADPFLRKILAGDDANTVLRY